ncbi:hypothetical protein DPPLL_13360 [Desulfofustis limnaeus]|uniref:Uncharacterized protein n=1 Tax=Desulfofustis limnaeus TaxID=2740163 RepID=A0ABM7W7W5_9BACT|nr:hypothetical protein DPPLL_13360 [Desulfofustis limnaeus]
MLNVILCYFLKHKRTQFLIVTTNGQGATPVPEETGEKSRTDNLSHGNKRTNQAIVTYPIGTKGE